MVIRVGFSADPDDAFMFWGLASGTVDARGYEFEPVIQDIQTLNEWALDGRLEVTAMSLATYPHVRDRYVLLPHGASIGSGYGPIVVAREQLTLDELRETEIVIPGEVSQILRESIEAALDNRGEALAYALGFGRGMDAVRGDSFIGMYVNELTRDYGDEGRQAVRELLSRAHHDVQVEWVQ